MHQTPDSKKKILHRLKIARGHMDKVISMVENDEYCIGVIHQSQAVQAALKQADAILLENHLKNCVVNQIKSGDSRKTIDEIMKIVQKT